MLGGAKAASFPEESEPANIYTNNYKNSTSKDIGLQGKVAGEPNPGTSIYPMGATQGERFKYLTDDGIQEEGKSQR